MPENAIKSAVAKLKESGLAAPAEIRGCTADQISALEVQTRVTLPSAYRSFLRMMGIGAGDFLVGTDWTFRNLVGLKAAAGRLLKRSRVEVAPLSASTFVFAMHQGYQFLYFDATASADPPVFLFLEGEAAPRQVFGRFSKWLNECVDDEIAAYHMLIERIRNQRT
jgi:hypothetical protein